MEDKNATMIETLKSLDPTTAHSPYKVAADYEMTLSDLINLVKENKELEKAYDIYLTKYKSKILQWALDNKNTAIADKLLTESQIVNSEDGDNGNDLELSFTIGKVDIDGNN